MLKEFSEFSAGPARVFRSPGRVNIIGEHTDYCDGLVLPTNTAIYTWLVAAARDDRIVRVRTQDLQDVQQFSLDQIEKSDNPAWIDYVKGVAAVIESQGLCLQGADLLVSSELPIGGGLSSSAAFELAIASALLDIAAIQLPSATIARLCQQAEIEYAKVNCGIMDQFAVACCERDRAMLLDCRTLRTKHARIPDDMRLLIVDSGVKHALPDGDYNNRARECVDAARLLREQIPDIVALRDLTEDQLEKSKAMLGDVLYRRCRHVVTENERVRFAFAALENQDLLSLGSLIAKSHVSLRDDFEVSCDDVNRLVDIADCCDAVLGSRMVGAGFGGCVLALTTAGSVDSVVKTIRSQYVNPAGREPWMHVVKPTAAVQAITLP